jgi:hypothetical protein
LKLKEQLINSASPAEVNLIFLILMVLIGAMDALRGMPKLTMKGINEMSDAKIIMWVVGIFLVLVIWGVGRGLHNEEIDPNCGSQQFTAQYCE